MPAKSEFDAVFNRLRGILEKSGSALTVDDDTPGRRIRLAARVGPATLKAWGGKAKTPTIPVAWVEVGKAYVSYHLMGIEHPALQGAMSTSLKARMQGKTCFNFTHGDEALFKELETVTSSCIASFRKAGFIEA